MWRLSVQTSVTRVSISLIDPWRDSLSRFSYLPALNDPKTQAAKSLLVISSPAIAVIRFVFTRSAQIPRPRCYRGDSRGELESIFCRPSARMQMRGCTCRRGLKTSGQNATRAGQSRIIRGERAPFQLHRESPELSGKTRPPYAK